MQASENLHKFSGDRFRGGFRTSLAKETVCNGPLHSSAKLKQAVLGTIASQSREMRRQRDFWTIIVKRNLTMYAKPLAVV